MTDAPERIWAWREVRKPDRAGSPTDNLWCEPDAAPYEAMADAEQYILATPEALAAGPEVQALIAAERGACAAIADSLAYPDETKISARIRDAIRNRGAKP